MLPESMSLIYHMTEFMQHSASDERGAVAEDEGVGCHANRLPRLLGIIIDILTNRPATDQVIIISSSSIEYVPLFVPDVGTM